MEQKKLQDILKMSLKLSDQENVELANTEMDEERKQWLQGVISKALEDDEGKRIVMMTQLFLTYKPGENFEEDRLLELENLYQELNYLVEGFDIGKLFNSNGGMKHNLGFLEKSPHQEIKIEAANLIGNCTHNNPTVQKTILENNGMELLLQYIKTSDNNLLVVKCLYALSTLIGGYEDSEKYFAKLEGSTFFIKMLDHSHEKVQIKTAFLLIKLSNSKVIPVSHFVTSDLIKKIMKLLEEDNDTLHQHLLHALIPCFEKTKVADLLSGVDGKMTVKEFFQKLQLKYKQKDEEMFKSEIESCDIILDLLK